MLGVMRALRSLLLPPRCAGCGQVGWWWCAACHSACGAGRAGRGVPGCAGVVVGGYYSGPLRRAVLALKRDRPGLAAVLAAALWEGRLPPVDCVTWVPAGPGRRRRGYDQARALARAAGGLTGAPVAPLLVRVRGPGQRGLGAAARKANAASGLKARGRIPKLRVLLVDDVVTTGASLSAGAAALLAAGAYQVHVAVVAAAPPGRTSARHSSALVTVPKE